MFLCGNVNACSGRGLFTQVDRRGKARRHVWRYFAPAQLLNGSTDRLVESRNRAGVAGNHGSRDRGRSRRCAMRAVAPVAGAVAKRNRKPAFVGARIGDGRARGLKRSRTHFYRDRQSQAGSQLLLAFDRNKIHLLARVR